jgi:NH3-dependent NAD+ synthetase
MIYLYNLASTLNGIVIDTDNLTEYYLGFFTIHGDMGDYNPIGGLWKHEIYELATYLRDTYDRHTRYYADGFGSLDDRREIEANERKVEALNHALGIRPTDGNGVNDLGDMGQIAPAFVHDKNVDAYTKVDDIIQTYLKYYKKPYPEYLNAIDILKETYNNETYNTVGDIINRIERTEYKRKELPIVINRKLYA